MASTRMKHPLILKQFYYSLLVLCMFSMSVQAVENSQWSQTELAFLELQWIGSLPALPPDPSNQFADDVAAARLGHKLFFDHRFSSNGKVSCASCHLPEKSFTDGLAVAKGIAESSRHTPNIIGIAYSPWFFWDGRSDSLWSQALSPLESSVEHGGNRSQYARIIHDDPDYRKRYQEIFGPLPDLSDIKRFPVNAAPGDNDAWSTRWYKMTDFDQKIITRIFVNIGKAIAAYQRLLMPSASRFDKYVSAVLKNEPSSVLTNDEIAGLKLFIGKAMCVSCHQGPLFSNHSFHNVGAPDPASDKPLIPFLNFFKEKQLFDVGRYKGVRQVQKNEFNCLSEYSDAAADDCAELRFANTKHSATLGAFKVPTLRNIAITAPYFHIGQFANLSEVLNHYNEAIDAPVGHNEIKPLNLNKNELAQIEAFLHSLSSPPTVAADWLNATQSN